ncbi:MAG: hypothetical protein Q7R81_07690 [Candidatus Peregrinibacteria bacterium]|nr:hypothetical protein [Candidatus Peregrinibacteria bacterium]
MAKHTSPSTPSSSPKKRGGCRRLFRGCLWFLLILLILVGLIAALFYRVPERLGLGSTRAEKLLSPTPDRVASAKMLDEATAAGLSANGVHLYVLPMKDGSASIAFAILRATEGFAFARGQRDPVIQTLVTLGTTATARQSGVAVVGLEFYDEKGRSYMTIAARTEDIQKVAQGQITDEEFMRIAYGDVRIDEVFSAEMDALKEFLSSSSSSSE